MRISDAIGISIVIIGLALTALNMFAIRGQFADVKDFTIHQTNCPEVGKPLEKGAQK